MSKKNLKLTTIFLALFFVIAPFKLLAATDTKPPILQIDIPTVNLSDLTICDKDNKMMCIPWIAEYIVGIYKYGIGVAGILAAIVLMWGGVVWLTAGGNQQRVTEAQGWIKGSLTGIVLLMTSYLILYQINPDLTIFNAVKIKQIPEMNIEEEYLYESTTDYESGLSDSTNVSDFKHIKFYQRTADDLPRLDKRLIELLHIIDDAGFDVVVSCAITGHRVTTVTDKKSRHTQGLAVDIVTSTKGSTRQEVLTKLSDFLYSKYRTNIGEMIYSYNLNKSIKDGAAYTLTNNALLNTHYNHLHLATFKK